MPGGKGKSAGGKSSGGKTSVEGSKKQQSHSARAGLQVREMHVLAWPDDAGFGDAATQPIKPRRALAQTRARWGSEMGRMTNFDFAVADSFDKSLRRVKSSAVVNIVIWKLRISGAQLSHTFHRFLCALGSLSPPPIASSGR